MRNITLFAIAMLVAASTAMAQDFSFSAQFRERSELDAKTIYTGQSMDVFHLLRTRFSVNAAVNEDVTVFMELQDARQMGTESSTMNSGASAFDLRQGFLKVENLGHSIFDAKVGRMVLAYGNERLIGAIDWSNYGQSFDGGVLSAQLKNVRIDVLGVSLVHNMANPYVRDAFLAGLWGVWNPMADANSIQPFFLYDNPRIPISLDDDTRVRRYTAGVYTNWMFDAFDIAVDGAYQFGEFPETQISGTNTDPVAIAAYMVGARAGYTFEDAANLRIGVGIDMLSGNQAPDEGQPEETIEAFSTLYATNHKFYGAMDYFTTINNYDNNLGLRDMMVDVSVEPSQAWKAGVSVHIFNTMVDPVDFLPAGISSDRTTDLGMELDMWTTFAVAKAVWATLGFSVMDWAEQDKIAYYMPYMKTTKWGWAQVMVNI